MEKQYALLLPKDNSQPQLVEFKAKEDGLMDTEWCCGLIGCDLFDIVRTIVPEAVLVVDDEGLLKEEVTVNIPASIMYGALEHGQPLVGSALLCKEEERPDGVYTVGLPEDEAKKLLDFFVSVSPIGGEEE